MKTDYDVIVVGAGIAGMITATAASKYSNQDLRILVIDRNSRQEVGKKTSSGWTCGDAVSKKSIDYLSNELGIPYGSPEIEHLVKGVMLYSPDHETSILFEGSGYILNRKLLAKRQLKDAEELGVEFAFQVSAERLYYEDSFVKGVEGRDLVDGSAFKKTAKVVIDASGSASRLRIHLPVRSYIEREINKEYDLESVGRYILYFEKGSDDPTYFDQNFALIHFDQILAPGGYAWVFPKGENKANIGIGFQQRFLEKRNKMLGKQDNLQSLIDGFVKKNLAIRNPRLADGEEDIGNAKSNWQVPVRRQNDCMVANGYAIVGDAAWMPRPIDAGGMGPAIYGSTILGRTIVKALQSEDVSEKGLWNYNYEYMKIYGYRMASFEVLRRFMQTLSNRQLNYGLKHFVSEEDIQKITERKHPEFQRATELTPSRVLWALFSPRLALGLRSIVNKSRKLIAHNLSYPEGPEGFPEWQRILLKELNEAYGRFY